MGLQVFCTLHFEPFVQLDVDRLYYSAHIDLTCSRALQLWAKPGPLPQEVQSLTGAFTDAPNACIIEQDAPKGIASWWRYQGFKL